MIDTERMIEQTAEMLRQGYSDDEIIRMMKIPAYVAYKIIDWAESWNREETIMLRDIDSRDYASSALDSIPDCEDSDSYYSREEADELY